MHDEPPNPDELEIDMEMEDAIVEELGSYASVEAYLLAQVEDHFLREGLWLLECLDLVKLREHFEAGRFKYLARGGKIYRVEG